MRGIGNKAEYWVHILRV